MYDPNVVGVAAATASHAPDKPDKMSSVASPTVFNPHHGSRPWVVLKYGGTSVASARNWGHILTRVKALLPTNRVWLTVSALSGVRTLFLPGVWWRCSG